jgi:hypothetical protein
MAVLFSWMTRIFEQVLSLDTIDARFLDTT